jgi:hypothetical protein
VNPKTRLDECSEQPQQIWVEYLILCKGANSAGDQMSGCTSSSPCQGSSQATIPRQSRETIISNQMSIEIQEAESWNGFQGDESHKIVMG